MVVAPSIRLFPSSFSSIPFPHRSLFSSRWRFSSSLSLPRPIHSRLYSTAANGDIGVELPGDQAEILFMGTGTSEGIPRVCSKATQPGNKNRRLNTSILGRHPSSSGTQNILIDAGKSDPASIFFEGLDDLRDWTNNVQPHIPIYVAKRDFESEKLQSSERGTGKFILHMFLGKFIIEWTETDREDEGVGPKKKKLVAFAVLNAMVTPLPPKLKAMLIGTTPLFIDPLESQGMDHYCTFTTLLSNIFLSFCYS
ncbi:hypothetical protein PIB30_037038 [Stylosanthes scabra]|uniref:Uncharacterized protein n=1 Tax=Stylosanthes scabra TaxID=79078 RepID=A0ABU6TDA8_9FABA|nr:hypothetical protein [Stylosanthes scabra]